MSASDYRSGESRSGVSLIARREIHRHANSLLLGASSVIQHLRDIDFLIHLSLTLYFWSACHGIVPHI